MNIKSGYLVRSDIKVGTKINGIEFTEGHAKYVGHSVKIEQLRKCEDTGIVLGINRHEWPEFFFEGPSSEEYMLRDDKVARIFNNWYIGVQESTSTVREGEIKEKTIKGVCFAKKQGKWKAYINLKKTGGKTQHKHLGSFATSQEATIARLDYEMKYQASKVPDYLKNMYTRLVNKTRELKAQNLSWETYLAQGGK